MNQKPKNPALASSASKQKKAKLKAIVEEIKGNEALKKQEEFKQTKKVNEAIQEVAKQGNSDPGAGDLPPCPAQSTGFLSFLVAMGFNIYLKKVDKGALTQDEKDMLKTPCDEIEQKYLSPLVQKYINESSPLLKLLTVGFYVYSNHNAIPQLLGKTEAPKTPPVEAAPEATPEIKSTEAPAQ